MLELFVTGAKPRSGKTFITAGLAATMQSLGYSTGVYLPVQTGAVEEDGFMQAPDLIFVKSMDYNIKTWCSYIFTSKDLPCIAAQQENQVIEKDVILQDFLSISEKYECLMVNGTEGLSTPYGKDFLEEDLIKTLNLPLLLVASPRQSSFNDILMTINHARENNILIRGVILNDCPFNTQDANIKNLPRMIEEYSGVRVLGIIPHIENLRYFKPQDIISYILTGVDIETVFDVKIAKLSL